MPREDLQKRTRGRPPSGRKGVVQIALGEDEAAYIDAMAAKQGETISSVGRRLIEEAIAAREKSKARR